MGPCERCLLWQHGLCPMWLRILTWREHPASSRWALNIITNVLTFVRKLEKIQPQKRRRQHDHRGEVRVMQWPCKQQKAKQRAKDSSHTVKEMKTSPMSLPCHVAQHFLVGAFRSEVRVVPWGRGSSPQLGSWKREGPPVTAVCFCWGKDPSPGQWRGLAHSHGCHLHRGYSATSMGGLMPAHSNRHLDFFFFSTSLNNCSLF